MSRYVHDANIDHYRKLIVESLADPSRDEARHKMLLTLLADELAQDKRPPDGQTLA
jgi:hypothetical protein